MLPGNNSVISMRKQTSSSKDNSEQKSEHSSFTHFKIGAHLAVSTYFPFVQSHRKYGLHFRKSQ